LNKVMGRTNVFVVNNVRRFALRDSHIDDGDSRTTRVAKGNPANLDDLNVPVEVPVPSNSSQ